MANSNLKRLVKNYLILISWYLLHHGNNSITSKQFEIVLSEIGELENSLKENNISENLINKLINFAEQQIKIPLELLSEKIQLRLSRIIFGSSTNWTPDMEGNP